MENVIMHPFEMGWVTTNVATKDIKKKEKKEKKKPKKKKPPMGFHKRG
jgi:hypothetical protein